MHAKLSMTNFPYCGHNLRARKVQTQKLNLSSSPAIQHTFKYIIHSLHWLFCPGPPGSFLLLPLLSLSLLCKLITLQRFWPSSRFHVFIFLYFSLLSNHLPTISIITNLGMILNFLLATYTSHLSSRTIYQTTSSGVTVIQEGRDYILTYHSISNTWHSS